MTRGPVVCRCACGYACRRACGLRLAQCMDEHYRQDCEHVWDGEFVETAMGSSVTCSRCGLSADTHDARCGP